MIAQRPIDQLEPPVRPTGVARFERFFRRAAGLDCRRQDLKRYSGFVNHKIYDLLAGQESARTNGRDRIEPIDLPITKGLQQSIQAFVGIDEKIALQPILDYLTARPPLDLPFSAETEQQLACIAGGLSVALARSFKILDPNLKNPASEHWERARPLFDLLL
jgi:hypothetical protein